jgi:hypothetical protein
MPRSFDSLRQASLVLGTCSRLAARPNPPKFIYVSFQILVVLIVDIIDMIHTESANSPARCISSPSSAPGTPLSTSLSLHLITPHKGSGAYVDKRIPVPITPLPFIHARINPRAQACCLPLGSLVR